MTEVGSKAESLTSTAKATGPRGPNFSRLAPAISPTLCVAPTRLTGQSESAPNYKRQHNERSGCDAGIGEGVGFNMHHERA